MKRRRWEPEQMLEGLMGRPIGELCAERDEPEPPPVHQRRLVTDDHPHLLAEHPAFGVELGDGPLGGLSQLILIGGVASRPI